MARHEKNPIFSRKLQELEHEAERLDDHIKMLSKSLRKFEATGELPASAPAPRATPRYSRTAISPSAAKFLEPPPGPAMIDPDPASDETSPDVFANASPGDLLPGLKPKPAEKKKPLTDAEKFASYFASGSFGKSRPLTHEKKLQRNKAVFMLVFALIIAYVFFRAVS